VKLAPRTWFGRSQAAVMYPSPGYNGTLSGGLQRGSIPFVGSLGLSRDATYRGVYLSNPWVWGAVNMISRGLGRLPLHVYELDERGRKRRIRGDLPSTPGRPTGGQSLDRLLSTPTQGMSRNAMFKSTARDWLIHGNALWEIVSTPGNLPNGLRRHPWASVVRVKTGRDGSVSYYEVNERDELSGERRKLAFQDVIHFGYGSDDGAVAVSPLEACRYTLALHDALIRHLIAYFQNAMRPSGHLSVEKLTREQSQQLREMITELYTSPENAGKVLVTSGKWESMADTPDNAQLVELVKLSREEIAAAYAVPPPVLGILDQAIKSNVKELREQYGRDSVGPWASDFEQELQAQLLAPRTGSWSSLFVEFQLAEILRPDLEARAMVYQRLAPFFTIDEVRGFENMAPLDLAGASDQPWVPSGAMPLTTAARGKQPAGFSALDDEGLVALADLLADRLKPQANSNGNGHHPERSEVST
jgi:HK97 family phage portal protein